MRLPVPAPPRGGLDEKTSEERGFTTTLQKHYDSTDLSIHNVGMSKPVDSKSFSQGLIRAQQVIRTPVRCYTPSGSSGSTMLWRSHRHKGGKTVKTLVRLMPLLLVVAPAALQAGVRLSNHNQTKAK